MADGVFRARRRPIRRRRLVLGGSPIRAQAGQTGIGGGATGQAVKVVALGGRLAGGLGGAAQAVKAQAHTGVLAVGLGGTAVDRKVATPHTADGIGAGATSSGLARIALQGGVTSGAVAIRSTVRAPYPAAVGVGGTATGLVKTVTLTGTLSVAVGGAGAAAKSVTPTRSRSGLGVSGCGAATKTVEFDWTVEPVVVTGFATSPYRGFGVVDLPTTVSGVAVRVALVAGATGVGVSGSGLLKRRMPVRGTDGAALGTWSFSKSKRIPQTGRGYVGVGGRGDAIRVGSTIGVRISPPFPLLAGRRSLPVAGSLIRWETTIPHGATVTVETSIDNGGTWQKASNGQAIPRLEPGLVIPTVMTRVTLTRRSGMDPTPRVHRLEVRVSLKASRVEMVQLGRFLINEVQIQDSPDGAVIEIAGNDLSRKIDRNRWDRTVVVPEGTLTTEAIKMLARNRFPNVVFNFVTSNERTPRLFFGEQAQNSPWQDMLDLARDIGCELFFDAYGVLTLRKVPDPNVDEAQFIFDERSKPTITELTRRVTDEDTYNYVIVTGESSYNQRPVRGTAADDDPGSPTYVGGPYGVVALRVTSPAVVTEYQAWEAARALLRKKKGATEQVDITAVPMPALEVSDVVGVERTRSKVTGRFLADYIYIPLGASEQMRLTCRRQRY